jgi:hypothetical protein
MAEHRIRILVDQFKNGMAEHIPEKYHDLLKKAEVE